MVRKRSDFLDKVRVAAGLDVRHEPPGFAHVTIVAWTVYMPDIRFVRINKPRHTVDFRPFWAIIRFKGVLYLLATTSTFLKYY